MTSFSALLSSFSKESACRPRRVIRPDWAGHIPFQFLLFRRFHPQLYVELGVFHGDSYCAGCQAVETFSLNTKLVGIDSWEGDIHIGGYSSDVLKRLKDHHDPRYSAFSSLEKGFFEHKLDLFENHQIDLLHIDGEHTYEAVRNDFETWLPKVSKNGIILFHDTDVFGRPDFGVWQFWEELESRYETFRFIHCNGLGILSVGPANELPADIRWLFELAEDQISLVRTYFAAVGEKYIERSMRALNENSLQMKRAAYQATFGGD